MRQHQPHKVIELGLLFDFHRYLAAVIRSADHIRCGGALYREIAGLVLPGNLLPVNVIKAISLDDLGDDHTGRIELEFCTGQRAEA